MKLIILVVFVIIIVVFRVAARREAAPKGRVPAGPLQRALDTLKRKTVHLVFVPEYFENALIAAALQREFSLLFEKAEMVKVASDAELTIFLLYTSGPRLQFRFQLPNGRTAGPFDFVDVQLTGRYSTLDDPQARFIAKAPGYAEQVIYSIAAIIIDPTGDTKL